ncbi:MAG: DUF6599 family protein [Bryobacteraceae bacterium]|jgi:hypothetical protein
MRLLPILMLPALAAAAILPGTIGPYRRVSSGAPELTDPAVWQEYALRSAETGAYENGKSTLAVTVWRLADTTASLAAFDWQRPAASVPSKAAPLAAETADSLLLVHGNYLLRFSGYKPKAGELDALVQNLNNVDATTLPVLPGYLPATGLVPNSERYAIGAAGLAKFDPAIPPATAAFHYGTEVQIGAFHSPKGDMTLAIFDYPSPQIAIRRIGDFQKLPGAMARRTGPLIAVVVSPPDPDRAERLLGEIRYQAEITQDEYIPTKRDNIGNLIINIFILIGILIGFSTLSGLLVGGFRTLARYVRHGEEPDAMITLHLE